MPRLLDGADVGVLVLVLACFALALPTYWPYVNDDAFISFRYAANLLGGAGLTFNPGERVEGYTNFLWVLVCAVLLWTGGSESLPALAKGAGALCAAATLVVTYAIARRTLEHRLAAAFPALLLALNPGFGANAVSGLETALFTLLLAAALLLRTDPRAERDAAFGIALALATLTRPEGAYVFTVLILFHGVEAVPWRRIARVVAAYAAVVGPYLAWKWLYYGALLPNTYHAKPADLRFGLDYVARFAVEGGYTRFLALPLWALVLGGIALRRRPRWHLAFAAALSSAVVLSGGDWMLGWRFWVPVLPVLFLILAAAVDRLLGWLEPRSRTAALAAALAACVPIAWALAAPRREIATQCRERGAGQREAHLYIAEWLRREARPGDSIALMDVGMIGFHTGLYTIDISGLVEPFIARSPGPMIHKLYDPAYVLARRPDWIVLVGNRLPRGSAEAGWVFDPRAFWFQDGRIAVHPAFLRDYEYLFSRLASFEGYLHVFRRTE